MAVVQLSDFLDLIPAMLQAPHRSMHCTYDEPADVMYVNFAGLYHDRTEALDDAVSLLRRREKLIEDVNHGIEQISRGETVPFDLGEMKAALQRHLQAR